LAGTGALAAAGAVASGVAGASAANAADAEMFANIQPSVGRIVHDPDLCCGCRVCEIVCTLSHWGFVNPDYSNIRIRTDILGGYISEAETCKQCDGPECVAACPTGALHIDPETGARVIDQDVCVGCQMCLNACPAQPSNIHHNPQSGTCIKCDLCGGEPRCVSNCPAHALSASWIEAEGDENVYQTSSGIVVTLDISGAVIVVSPDSVVFSDIDAQVTDSGVVVSGVISSTYTQPFEAKIKATYFDAAGQILHFAERTVVSLDVNDTQSFQEVFETSDPQAVAACVLEIMCGKIAG